MRVLFITAYYPPLNAIASFRVKGFVDACERLGIGYDVITRKYDDEQNKGKNMFIAAHKPTNFQEDYIRIGNVYYTNFEENNLTVNFSKKLPPLVRGIFNYLKIDVFHYGWLGNIMKVFEKELRQNKYDFIIASYGPPISLLAAKKISEKASVPYVADFRDAFMDGSEKNFHKIFKKWQLKVLMKKCSAYVFASDGMSDIFSKILNDKKIYSTIIYNGTEINSSDSFDDADALVVSEFNKIMSENDLVLLHSGTLYTGQNILFFIESLKKLLSIRSDIKIALVFLGLPENNFSEIQQESFIYHLPRVQFNTSIYLQKRAGALLSPIWKDRYTGFNGKLFEYLQSGNNVIIGPHPQKDILLFLENFNYVFVCNEFEKFKELLLRLIDKSNANEIQINTNLLSRKYWSDQFITFLIQLKKDLGSI